MDNAQEFVESRLQHGVSLYDPAKAHAYYLRTRQLKGRRSVTDLTSTDQREGWAYVQSIVNGKKKLVLTNLADANKKALAQLKSNGQARTKEIRDNISAIIAALPPIPPGLSKEDRAKLSDGRKAQIASIRTDAINQRSQAITEIRASLDKARTNYKASREGIKAKFETELNQQFDSIKTNVL